MRTLSLLLSLSASALLAGSGNAWAQQAPASPADPPAMQSVRVFANTPQRKLRYEEARAVRGTYDMSNGWTLNVTAKGRDVLAEIDQRGPVRLVALSADKFVSPDGYTEMEFNVDGDPNEMIMRYVPDPLVSKVMVTTRLARR